MGSIMAGSATNPDVAAASGVVPPIAPEPMSMGAVLRIPMMRRLWYAQIVSVFGDFLALFAVISVLTFRFAATPQQVTGIQIAYLLPIAVLGIIAGVFVDRWPTKPTMVASDTLRAALVLLLMLSTRPWQYYAVLAAISVISSFFSPAQGVAVRSAVPLHGLRSANALMQQVMFGVRIVGPTLAAVLVASFGARVCYIADSVSFVLSALLIASVPFVAAAPAAPADAPVPDAGQSGLRRVGADMQQGIGFIVHHAALLFVVLAMAAGMFVLGCFGPLIAVYVRDSVHGSTRVFGFASALIGLGMFVGINLLTQVGKRIPNNVLVYAGLGGIAVGLLIMTLVTAMSSTMVATLVIGFAVSGIVIPAQTMIQQETPPALMGRVGSTVMSVIFSAQIGGLVLSGVLANAVGVRRVFGICAGLLGVLIVVGRLWMEPRGTEAVTAS